MVHDVAAPSTATWWRKGLSVCCHPRGLVMKKLKKCLTAKQLLFQPDRLTEQGPRKLMTERDANFKQGYLGQLIILLELWELRNCEKPTDKDGNTSLKKKKHTYFSM